MATKPTQTTESESNAAPSTPAPSTQKAPEAAVEDDSDPDFDDLDDVLDQFSAATASNQQPKSQEQPSQPAPTSSGPGRPAPTSSNTQSALPPDLLIPSGPKEGESEDAFMARLTSEMSSFLSKMNLDPAAAAETPEDIAKMGRELEEFTQKMEAEGIQPEDLLKAIMGEEAGSRIGDMAHGERDRRESESKSKSRSPESSRAAAAPSDVRPSSSAGGTSSKQQSASFESTIQRTMARMSESSAAATSATTTQQQKKSDEDLLADMLRALDSDGGADGSDGELSKMFLGMMEQLTNKDMLYEPMKELSEKFPVWLKENDPSAASSQKKQKKEKLSQADFERFTRQEKIVQDIVAKFEEKGYSDDDPKCREVIWEKMQEMQGEGAPPEDLIANPFPGMGGLGGLMGGGGGGDGGPDEGCPTQ